MNDQLRDLLTTVLEVVGAVAFVVGVALVFGAGLALMVGGTLLVGAGYVLAPAGASGQGP